MALGDLGGWKHERPSICFTTSSQIYLIICLAFWVTNCSQVSGVCQGIKQKFDRIVVESVSGK